MTNSHGWTCPQCISVIPFQSPLFKASLYLVASNVTSTFFYLSWVCCQSISVHDPNFSRYERGRNVPLSLASWCHGSARQHWQVPLIYIHGVMCVFLDLYCSSLSSYSNMIKCWHAMTFNIWGCVLGKVELLNVLRTFPEGPLPWALRCKNNLILTW